MIKGWAVSRFYPNTWERPFSDIDLLVKSEQFADAENLLIKYNIIDVDLHSDLRHLDSMSIDKLFAQSKLVKCGESDIRVLSYEDNLRVVCVHWLIDGGEYRWKLQDIKYLVENRPNDFSWEKCLNVVDLNRRNWILTTIALANRYENLDISELPFYQEIKNNTFLPNWLTKYLEKTWQNNNVGLVGLHKVLDQPSQLYLQLKKRFKPNPLQSTIEINGSIDEKPRIYYQIADIFWRMPPFFVRIFGRLIRNKKLQSYKW